MLLMRRLIAFLPVIFCLILHVTGTNNVSYIETEPLVNLQRGILGLLPCTVKQRAFGVSWWKSASADTGEQLLIQLDNPEKKTGPGFDQGLFDITSDHSLIIKNVQLSEGGEYFCEMVELTTRQAYRNETIVTVSDIAGVNDSYIETEPSVNLQNGTLGLLPCTVKQRAYSVSWWKSSPSGSDEQLLIHLDKFYHSGKKTGSGYEEGLFDIADDSSLIIKNVELSNVGKYLCRIGDSATGQVYRGETNATVFAPPSKPFPSIAECVEDNAYDTDHEECSLKSSSIAISLTCIVDRYSPSFMLKFTHKSRHMDVTDSREWENSDGSYGRSITIKAKTDSNPYVCIATGEDATGAVIRSSSKVTVRLQQTTAHIAIEITIVVMMFLVLLVFIVRNWPNEKNSMEKTMTCN